MNVVYTVGMGLLLVYESFYKTYTAGIYYGDLPGFPHQVTYVLGDTVEGIIIRSYIPCGSTLNLMRYCCHGAYTEDANSNCGLTSDL